MLLHPAITCTYFVRENLVALTRQYFKYGYWKTRTLRLHPDSLRLRQAGPPLLFLGLMASTVVGFHSRLLGMFLPLLYLVCNLLVSVAISSRSDWKYALGLPAVFGVVHLSWGAGFLIGLLRLCLPRRLPPAKTRRIASVPSSIGPEGMVTSKRSVD